MVSNFNCGNIISWFVKLFPQAVSSIQVVSWRCFSKLLPWSALLARKPTAHTVCDMWLTDSGRGFDWLTEVQEQLKVDYSPDWRKLKHTEWVCCWGPQMIRDTNWNRVEFCLCLSRRISVTHGQTISGWPTGKQCVEVHGHAISGGPRRRPFVGGERFFRYVTLRNSLSLFGIG